MFPHILRRQAHNDFSVSIPQTIQDIYRSISSHVYNNPKWVIDIEYQHYDDKNHKIGILSHSSSQVLSLPIKWDEFKSQPTISTIEEVQQVVTKYV